MKFIILGLALLCSPALYAQKKADDVPVFGKVEKTELLLKSCDFDKNAEALVLFDVDQVFCEIYAAAVVTRSDRHIRIKILNDKGLDQANIKLPYATKENSESIGNIQAQTYNLDAAGNIVVTKLDKKSIYSKVINKRISEKIFSFPEARAGSVIEYSYSVDASLDAGIKDWYFQGSLPVKYSRYTIDFPQDIEVSCHTHCFLPLEKKEDDNRVRDVKTYSMRNVPALRDEPYLSCQDDYLQRLSPDIIAITVGSKRYPMTQSWPKIMESLMEDDDFGQQLSKTIPRTLDLEQQLKTMTDPYRKMVTIYYYVRKNMTYNGYDNIWAMNGVKSAWKDKKGTSGEINLILVNLLKDAGLDGHPVLVRTSDHGRINMWTPGYWQFNKVMAYVTIDKRVYVLDATDKYASPNLIPFEVNTTEGLVIEKWESRKWGWKTLWNESQKFDDVVVIDGTIDEKGKMTGSAFVRSYDYSRAERIPELKKGNDKFVEKYFASANSGIKVDSFETENGDADTLPLVQKFLFDQTLNASGGYNYFSVNLFAGLEKNPFIADTRFSDIYFGAKKHYAILGNFTIPDGYSFEDLPKSVKMLMPDTSVVFTRYLKAKGTNLTASLELEFKKPLFGVDKYDYFREFYQKLFEFLNEQIIFKKNGAAAAAKN